MSRTNLREFSKPVPLAIFAATSMLMLAGIRPARAGAIVDNSFGTGGRVVTLGINSAVQSMVIQPDGKIIAVGSSSSAIVLTRYNTDGTPDRPSQGAWYILSSSGGNMSGVQFGIATDRIVPGDYDGDGVTDVAVFRNGTWYALQSTGGFIGVGWGAAGDTPVPAGYLPQ